MSNSSKQVEAVSPKKCELMVYLNYPLFPIYIYCIAFYIKIKMINNKKMMINNKK